MAIGRPTKLNDEVQSIIVNALKEGNTWRCAAGLAGVTPDCLEKWKVRGAKGEEPYETFLLQTRAAEMVAESRMLGAVTAAASGLEAFEDEMGIKRYVGDWKAGAWWLERRRWKHFWLQKPGRGSKDPSSMTDDEIRAALLKEAARLAMKNADFREALLARLKGDSE